MERAAPRSRAGRPSCGWSSKRPMADGLGVDLDTLGAVLETSLDGARDDGDDGRRGAHVVLMLPAADPEAQLELPVRTSGGQGRRRRRGASIEEVAGAREIFRRDQRRIAQVTARIAPEVASPRGARGGAAAHRGRRLPPGLDAELAGEESERVADASRAALGGGAGPGAGVHGAGRHLRVAASPRDRAGAIPLELVGVALALVPRGPADRHDGDARADHARRRRRQRRDAARSTRRSS